MNLAATLFIGITIYVIFLIVKFQNFRKRFKNIPESKLYPFKSPKGSKNDPSTDFFQLHIGLSKLFYNEGLVVVWIYTKPIVLLFNAALAEALLTSNKLTVMNKSSEYSILSSMIGNGLVTSPAEKWKKRRKLIIPSFHFRNLDQFLPIINEHVNVTLDILEKIKDTSEVDLYEVFGSLSLDIAGETSLGINFNAQTDSSQSEYHRALTVASNCFVKRIPRLWQHFNFLYNLTEDGKKFNKAVATMYSFNMKAIKERKLNFKNTEENENTNKYVMGNKRLAFLDLLLEEHFKDPLGFTEEALIEEVNTFVFAAHETSSTIETFVLYLLGLHLDIQEKVFQEIRMIFPDGKDKNVTLDDIKNMKYLDCVIKEASRLYTPIPVLGRNISVDTDIGRYKIPKGSNCWVIVPALHKDPKVFPNPEKFDPDRFSPENSSGRNPFAFIPFSTGPRNCIGQKYGGMVLRTVLARIINSFRVESLDPRDILRLKSEVVLKTEDRLRIRLTKR